MAKSKSNSRKSPHITDNIYDLLRRNYRFTNILPPALSQHATCLPRQEPHRTLWVMPPSSSSSLKPV